MQNNWMFYGKILLRIPLKTLQNYLRLQELMPPQLLTKHLRYDYYWPKKKTKYKFCNNNCNKHMPTVKRGYDFKSYSKSFNKWRSGIRKAWPKKKNKYRLCKKCIKTTPSLHNSSQSIFLWIINYYNNKIYYAKRFHSGTLFVKKVIKSLIMS